ncbi:uncharacterized protein [Miscanthus floridulus]|uniref:uncharacterized protein isoform X1 n=1 Tax=Miscanthus floridulus TaxID=154761 RepID=UPI003457FC79
MPLSVSTVTVAPQNHAVQISSSTPPPRAPHATHSQNLRCTIVPDAHSLAEAPGTPQLPARWTTGRLAGMRRAGSPPAAAWRCVVCKDSITGLRVVDLPIINTDLETGGGIGFPPAVEIFHTKVCRPTASSSAHRVQVQLLHRQYVLLRFTPPPSWLSRRHTGGGRRQGSAASNSSCKLTCRSRFCYLLQQDLCQELELDREQESKVHG